MRLFLDTSSLLAACGRPSGASAIVIDVAAERGWRLLTSLYAIDEAERNVWKLGGAAARRWPIILPQVEIVADVVSSPNVVVFPVPKDRPILLTAQAFADVLLTLDRRDFHERLGSTFYALAIQTPGDFLRRRPFTATSR